MKKNTAGSVARPAAGRAPGSLITGYERMGAWADILDRINVFPVADGDTGRNLMISLAPLRDAGSRAPQETIQQLLFSGRGNSGNIATRFVAELLSAVSYDTLYPAARAGAENARGAVNTPLSGTMLTVMDRFADALENVQNVRELEDDLESVIDQLQEAVRETPDMLPELRKAGVVDAGALGIFLFLEGFLRALCSREDRYTPVEKAFAGKLKIADGFDASGEEGFCIDFVVRMGKDAGASLREIASGDDSVTVQTFQDYAKIHLHTRDVSALKQKAKGMGDIVQWCEDDLHEQVKHFHRPAAQGAVHIVTDAAGSLTRGMARNLGVTLLESYVSLGETCAPETSVVPEELYREMRRGVKASTSQASDFERHQHYDRLLKQHDNVLYLCVGSVYTGNYRVVTQWKEQHDKEDRLAVIDTGAASGRLAAAVIATARYAAGDPKPAPEAVVRFAQKAVEMCGEYIFLDELRYLAAGGRMSKTGAFFGDMLNVKPVVTPTPRGAEKVGIVRNAEAQVRFAVDRFNKNLENESGALILLQYSDNRDWLEKRCIPEIKKHFPAPEMIVAPLSLTSGVHIGPGAWAAAFYGNSPQRS